MDPVKGEVGDRHFWIVERDGLTFGSGWHPDEHGPQGNKPKRDTHLSNANLNPSPRMVFPSPAGRTLVTRRRSLHR